MSKLFSGRMLTLSISNVNSKESENGMYILRNSIKGLSVSDPFWVELRVKPHQEVRVDRKKYGCSADLVSNNGKTYHRYFNQFLNYAVFFKFVLEHSIQLCPKN